MGFDPWMSEWGNPPERWLLLPCGGASRAHGAQQPVHPGIITLNT